MEYGLIRKDIEPTKTIQNVDTKVKSEFLYQYSDHVFFSLGDVCVMIGWWRFYLHLMYINYKEQKGPYLQLSLTWKVFDDHIYVDCFKCRQFDNHIYVDC